MKEVVAGQEKALVVIMNLRMDLRFKLYKAASLITQARVLTLGLSCYCDSCDGRELDCDQHLSFPLHLASGSWLVVTREARLTPRSRQ